MICTESKGTQFKTSMQNLMKLLLSKNPNYIRCIKPNDSKSPHKISKDLIRHQVIWKKRINEEIIELVYFFVENLGTLGFNYKIDKLRYGDPRISARILNFYS